MSIVLGIVGFLAFMVFGIAQLVAGLAGIEHGLGVGWAWGALIAALMFRFSCPSPLARSSIKTSLSTPRG